MEKKLTHPELLMLNLVSLFLEWMYYPYDVILFLINVNFLVVKKTQ